MNPQDLADSMGWTLTGVNDDGSATFQVIDDADVGKNFAIDADGNFSWLPDTPPPPSPPDLSDPGDGASSNGGDNNDDSQVTGPYAPPPTDPLPVISFPPVIDSGPGYTIPNTPPVDDGGETTVTGGGDGGGDPFTGSQEAMNPQDLADANGWTLTGINSDGSVTFQVVDAANVGKNFMIDADGNFSWLPDTPPPESTPLDPNGFTISTPGSGAGSIDPSQVTGPYAPPPTTPLPVISFPPPIQSGPGYTIPNTPPVDDGGESSPTGGGDGGGDPFTGIDNGGDGGNSGTMPVIGDPSHVYIGSHDGFDWYQQTDSAGTIHQWGVLQGDDSRNVIQDTLSIVGTAQTAAVKISDAQAAANGWIPAGIDASGRQQFSVPDAINNVYKVFSVNPDGQVDWSSLHDGGPIQQNTNPSGGSTQTGSPIGVPGGVTPTQPTMVAYTHPLSGAHGYIDSTWTLVGYTSKGNPVFQVKDSTGTVKEWYLDGNFNATGLINAQTFGIMAPIVDTTVTTTSGGGNTGGSGGNTGGGGTTGGGTTGGGGTTVTTAPTYKLFTHPLTGQTANIDTRWQQVGLTSKGNPVFQLKDEAGTVLEWYLDKNFDVQGLVHAQTLGVMVPIVDTTTTTTTTSTGGGGTTTTITPTMKSFTHPLTGQTANIDSRWQQVGLTSKGNPVFQLKDEAGTVLEWYLDTSFQEQGLEYAQTLGVMVPIVDTSTITLPTGGAVVTATGGTSGGTSTILIIAAVGLAAYFLARSKSSAPQRNPGPRARRRRRRART